MHVLVNLRRLGSMKKYKSTVLESQAALVPCWQTEYPIGWALMVGYTAIMHNIVLMNNVIF